MLELTSHQIQLQAAPLHKEAAIRQVGQILVNTGHIAPGYIESMLGREKVANTYLGNGITIPHGLPKDRELINKTGIAILQVPGGVTWNQGEIAHLIVGIAAKTDEHIEVLRRLTRVLGNKELVARLQTTTDPADIIEALTGERPLTPTTPERVADYPAYFDAILHNPTGLHARPATHFVELARQYQADIRVRFGNEIADGKTMLSLLQLGISGGSAIRVSAQGPDATEALQALQAAIAAGLGDEPEETPSPEATGTQEWTPKSVRATIVGVSAANGLAIGIIRQYTQQQIIVQDQPGDRLTEATQLENALATSKNELNQLYEEVKTRVGSGKASIFRAHAEFLNDTSLIQQTTSLIFKNHSAAWAWQQVIAERVKQMQKLDDPILAGRAVDLSDVGQRVLRHLAGIQTVAPATPDTPVILIANDLAPSDTAALDNDTILGFVTALGGPTSHTAIIARSLGIPAVVATGDIVLSVSDGTACILDGFNGKLYLEPSEADVRAARAVQQHLQTLQEAANATRFEPALTTDGHRVEIAANINRATGVPQAVEAGAEGVGLMRTEFLFLERDSIPSEEEQFKVYRDMVLALKGRPLVIRTLDIGGDKEVPYLNLPKEDNSFLGIRGIRLCLARPDLFIPQLRAIYRAAAFGPLQIMFPMIAILEDFEQAQEVAEQVRKELGAPEVPLGIMLEVPSAVLMADQFAKVVDFFSIGTNDLTQYTLAMDRLHPQLAKTTDALHPAVLRMVEKAVQAAKKEGKWVGVCGGIAGDPKGAVLLTGLGVSELSVSTPSVAAIKAEIRTKSLKEMQTLAQKALQCRTAQEVRAL
ncbi:MAG TPA: phosphoenolpyruvate--protein phosphotransferase [Anaerolineales bacterium]|nr:phosphoenolpyruvate--protein phosphotransferase [Anaerolineales bacterium]